MNCDVCAVFVFVCEWVEQELLDGQGRVWGAVRISGASREEVSDWVCARHLFARACLRVLSRRCRCGLSFACGGEGVGLAVDEWEVWLKIAESGRGRPAGIEVCW